MRLFLNSLGVLIAIIAVLYVGAGLYYGSKTYYEGEKSDHFDGKVFFNPFNPMQKSKWDVWKWRLTSDRAEWPKSVPLRQKDTPPEKVAGMKLRVTMINHASFLIQTGNVNILTDPIWSERASPVKWAGPKRVKEVGIDFDALPPIDIILISHNHYDHLDIPTIKRLWERDKPEIVTFLGNDTIIQNNIPDISVYSVDWEDEIEVKGLKIYGWPVQHWSARTPFDMNKALWGGFVIQSAGGHIFFGGDTGYGEGYPFKKAYERFGEFRLALLPIGAYEPHWFMKYSHFNPEDSVLAHLDLRSRTSIGMHYGTFQLTDEDYGAPLEGLNAALEHQGVNKRTFLVLDNGESRYIP